MNSADVWRAAVAAVLPRTSPVLILKARITRACRGGNIQSHAIRAAPGRAAMGGLCDRAPPQRPH
jgi:hypothetical protein